MCYRTDLGVAYFKVGPVKMEIAHDEPHKVVIFHGIFHDKEMDVAIDKAVPKFEKATVGKTQGININDPNLVGFDFTVFP